MIWWQLSVTINELLHAMRSKHGTTKYSVQPVFRDLAPPMKFIPYILCNKLHVEPNLIG